MNGLSFFTWEMLSTCTGALAMVLMLTEITKSLPLIKKIPTQLWSYITAVCVLLLASLFGGELTASGTALIFLNAAVIALAANGGYEALTKIFRKS